ncbi:aminopeptidase N-like isoform X2 [Rhodnius prolixus]|uniref:aminopeptidase N-like isoform X2 n=1 Tax=Rhodnius prolixus TaxID=13249 RepID=UPI003D188C50
MYATSLDSNQMWLLLTFAFCFSSVQSLPGYRLPGDVIPQNYRLECLADIEEPNFNFSGKVWIKIQCVKPTNTIILHSVGLEIPEEEVELKEIDTEENVVAQIPIIQQRLVPENEFYIIKLEQNLKSGKTYILYMPFSSSLKEELVGFYRSKYFDKASNATRWLGVTQFEATYARKAFPCFDEPEMKAKFSIRIGHKDKFKSISNMPLIKTSPVENKEEWTWSEFEESVPMSTYLVAYLVGDFEYREAPLRENNVTFRIWSRKEAIDQVELAKNVGPEILEYYEHYFDVKYPLPKQDMAAIPDFSAGAMENWGLITYRETALLYDEKNSGITSKKKVASVIAHELAHQWFGNLVTMKWWTDLWLNEGFATYVSLLGVNKIFPEWNYIEESIVNIIELIFELDSLKTSHQISKVIENANEISQIFDTISYKKGAAIIHMMSQFLGHSFERGVTDYLNKHKYGNAEQDDLWKALTDRAHKEGTLSKDMTVKEVMSSWTLQTGYPVVTVERNYKLGTVQVSQKRYLEIPPEGKDASTMESKSCWWVPLTYTTHSEHDFNNTTTKEWLKCGQPLQLKDVAKADEWLILNINFAGVYRVQYDDRNWRMIIKTINSDNYKMISPSNRASLLIDVFAFAWRGDVDYSLAFEVLSYLTRETEYIPISTGLERLLAIDQMLKRTPSYGHFEAFIRQLIKPIYQRYSKLLEIPDDIENLRMHALINSWACKYGLGTCRKQVEEIFNKWRSQADPDSDNIIPTNVRDVVYCTAIKFGDTETWDFLWKRYLNSNLGSEKSRLLRALACSRDIWILNRYLEWSIEHKSAIRKQDSIGTFSSVASQTVGLYVACEFLKNRLIDINKYHADRTSAIEGYLESCASNLVFKEEANKWKQFVLEHKDLLKGAKLVADQTVEKVTANTKWYNKHYKAIIKVLAVNQ